MDKPKRKNPLARFFRMLVEARWFFTFSSSVCATVSGIALTFGINSCRETHRIHKEIVKSLIQASDNLYDRMEETRNWVAVINRENRLYTRADSILSASGTIPDSVALEFYNSLPYVRLSAFDHDFEKIFRNSYQLWQLQNSNDSLRFYIEQCYDGVNMVEQTCQILTDEMLELIGAVNASRNFYRTAPKEWTLTLITDPRFQYFMSVRRVKTQIASSILSQVSEDYDAKVLPGIEKLKEK